MADTLSSDLASLKIQRDENPAAAARNRNLLIGVIVGVVVIAVVALAIVSTGHRMFASQVSITEIRLLSPASASTQVTATGYVVPQHESKVGAQILGRVAKVLVKEGDHVKAGDLLVQLDDADALAALAAAKARAEAAGARAAQAKTQHAREEKLAEQGASARATVEDLGNTYLAQQADADAAEADVRARQLDFDRTRIAAPIDGVVIGKPVEVGELVGPGTGPVLQLADFASIVVETDVPEARLHVIKPGAPAEIVLDAYPDVRHPGTVTEISPRVDRAKATVVVKVKFVDAADSALPDMAARVSFLDKALDAASLKEPSKLFVPSDAIAKRDGRDVVFTMGDDEKVKLEPVTLGPSMPGGYELKNGPPDGTKVVANPPSYLADGQRVKERE